MMAFPEFLDCLDSKEKMEGQAFPAYLESKVTMGSQAVPVNPARLVLLVRLVLLGLMVFLVSRENSESPDSLVSQPLK